MKKFKSELRIRRRIKFGKKLGLVIIFFAASYLLSLFSFFLYTQLSKILSPESKGFLGFVIIGLIAGLFALLVSLVNKRFLLTVVISFIIDCLVNSVFLYPTLGVKVVQFLPGLLVSMSAVIVLWHFLKIKLGLSKKKREAPPSTKEQVYSEYALARKLIENPNRLTLQTFKEACGLLQGINPKIDAVLKKADYVSRTLTFLKGGDALGFAVSNIKVKTEKDKKKKEKLLFFIDLVNDLREDIDVARVRLEAGKAGRFVDHPLRQSGHSMVTASSLSGIANVGMATIMATAVVAVNTGGNISNIPFLPTSQGINPSKVTETITPTALPTVTQKNLPTETPKAVATLAFSVVEKTIFVSALEEGTSFNAGSTNTYRFTITAGASETSPVKSQPDRPETWGWNTRIFIYKNKPVDWSGPSFGWGTTPANWNYSVGEQNFKPTAAEAEQIGKGKYIDISLQKGEYLIFLVPDSKGDFGDNSGGVYIQVQKGTILIPTPETPSETQGFIPYAECTELPPLPNSSFPLLNVYSSDNGERPLVNTLELQSGRSYWVRMSDGMNGGLFRDKEDKSEAEAIAYVNKEDITFSVILNGSELKLSGATKIEYNNYADFWEINGYYCTGILEKGSHKIVGTSYHGGNYVDSASLTLIAK